MPTDKLDTEGVDMNSELAPTAAELGVSALVAGAGQSRSNGDQAQPVPHRNEDLLRKVYAAFATGDLAALFALFAEDFEWHMAGQFPLAGDYKGAEEVKGLFGKIFQLLGPDGSLQLAPEEILANDDYAVALVHYIGRRGDKALDMRNIHVWRVAGGELAEYWFHPRDLRAVEIFWS